MDDSGPVATSPEGVAVLPEEWQRLVQQAVDLLVVVDGSGHVVALNPAAERLLGVVADEVIGRMALDAVHSEDRDRTLTELGTAFADGTAVVAFEHRVLTRDGRSRRLLWSVRPVPDLDRAYLVGKDVTDQGGGGLDDADLAVPHDEASPVEHAELLERVAVALVGAERDGGTVALLAGAFAPLAQVDGHSAFEVDDVVLGAALRRLSTALEATDELVRTGPREFWVIVPSVYDDGEAHDRAEAVAAALHEPHQVGGAEVRLPVALGVATGQADAIAPELVHDALVGRRLAAAGPGSRAVLVGGLTPRPAARRRAEDDLRRAIGAGELELRYQPELSLRDGALVGVEALVHWRHPERGLLGPDDIVPLAERTDLALELGRWVLATACRQAVAWDRGPLGGPEVPVVVNVWPRQLCSDGLVTQVRSALAAHRLAGLRLRLDVTERALAESPRASATAINRLVTTGVRVAIDDFGSTALPVPSLRHLPVEQVKIDRSFAAGLGRDPDTEGVARMLVGLVHELHLPALVEGVEGAEEEGVARRVGADRAQGFCWTRPLSPADLEAWVRGRALTPARAVVGAGPTLGVPGPSSMGDRPSLRLLLPCEDDARAQAAEATYEATRAMLTVTSAEEAVGILVTLVRRLGGDVVSARLADEEALPLDLSFGEGEPLLARADAHSLARLHLESVLPTVVEDAHAAVERARHLERVKEDAVVDPLTGLLNRRSLQRLLSRLGPGDVVVMVDLDHFKRVNDGLGHSEGDEVLRAFSRCLRATVRLEDGCCRYGGEEFLVVLRRADPAAALAMLERLRSSWDAARPAPMTFSAGVAEVGEAGGKAAIEAADDALYRAKARGRNRSEVAR